MPEPILQTGRRETEPESLWISALKVGGKLIVTLILAAIAVALIVRDVRGGYSYLRHLTQVDEIRTEAWSVLLVALGVYLAIFGAFSFLVRQLWFSKRREMPEPPREQASPWLSALSEGARLIGTLILAAIALALFLVGGLVGGYLYLMQSDEELKNQVWSTLRVAIGAYIVVFAFLGVLSGALWRRK